MKRAIAANKKEYYQRNVLESVLRRTRRFLH